MDVAPSAHLTLASPGTTASQNDDVGRVVEGSGHVYRASGRSFALVLSAP